MEKRGEFMTTVIKFISTGGYSGYSPIAPGTAGSIVGIFIYIFIFRLNPPLYLLLIVFVVMIGVWSSGEAEEIFEKKDSQEIVIDEVAGMLISLFLLPHGFFIIFSGFLIFRIIDIVKPFYILEGLPHGFGVMMDDVAAGISTNLILRIFLFLIS
jgi:phosphatidylglycerophosphatase A